MNTYGINKLKEVVNPGNEVSNEIVNDVTETDETTEGEQAQEETENEEVQTSENVSE